MQRNRRHLYCRGEEIFDVRGTVRVEGTDMVFLGRMKRYYPYGGRYYSKLEALQEGILVPVKEFEQKNDCGEYAFPLYSPEKQGPVPENYYNLPF